MLERIEPITIGHQELCKLVCEAQVQSKKTVMVLTTRRMVPIRLNELSYYIDAKGGADLKRVDVTTPYHWMKYLRDDARHEIIVVDATHARTGIFVEALRASPKRIWIRHWHAAELAHCIAGKVRQ